MNAPHPGKTRKSSFLPLAALVLVVLIACAVAWVMGMDGRGQASHPSDETRSTDSSPGSRGPGESVIAIEADLAFPDSLISPDVEEGAARDRSGLPENADQYRPLPLPDPTKHPSTSSGDHPETLDSHEIGDNPSP